MAMADKNNLAGKANKCPVSHQEADETSLGVQNAPKHEKAARGDLLD